mgnify:CR=1 FL=1
MADAPPGTIPQGTGDAPVWPRYPPRAGYRPYGRPLRSKLRRQLELNGELDREREHAKALTAQLEAQGVRREAWGVGAAARTRTGTPRRRAAAVAARSAARNWLCARCAAASCSRGQNLRRSASVLRAAACFLKFFSY